MATSAAAASERNLKFSYTWVLHKFSNLTSNYPNGKELISPVFSDNENKYKWKLWCYPNGNITYKDTVNVYLYQISKFDIWTYFTIYLKNSDDEILESEDSKHKFTKTSDNWGSVSEIKTGDLLTKLKDDILKICVKINITSKDNNASQPPEIKVVSDFEMAFKSKTLIDFEFKGDNFKIPVHKFVMAARSPVFRQMLEHDTLERKEGCVHISDMTEETTNLLVEFLYRGKLDDLNEDKAMKLLYAADKYDLSELKNICGDYLLEELKLPNVVDILLLADSHNVDYLRKAAITYIVENHWKFVNTSTLQEIFEKLPKKIIFELLSEFIKALPCETKRDESK